MSATCGPARGGRSGPARLETRWKVDCLGCSQKMRSGALKPLCYPSREILLPPGPVAGGTHGRSGVRAIRAPLVSLQAHDKWMSEALVEARKVGSEGRWSPGVGAA